ncbi:macro domain-containing protein [Gordonia sp. w5E2]|uniref:macro domain-containing protein n=1 Tax=Gordonia TaxID=2053 RepID=UPI001C3F3097|nr:MULTISPECIES: macro domain-containing protein [Gordonia]
MRRYAEGLARRFLEALGALAVLAGAVALFAPDLIKGQWWLLIVAGAIAAAWALIFLRQKDPEQRFPAENIVIRLITGDLFDQKESSLIGMTTTFDTEPGIIDRGSVQGNMLRVIYGDSQSRLDAELASALAGTATVGTITKPGKKDVYPVGTVAVLRGQGTSHYYCVAYTTMDEHNRAKGTIRGILDSLDSVWDAADRCGNGEPICVPLLGQGQSRIPELTAEVAVRLIAFSFLLRTRRSRFSKELRIVVHPNEIGKIDRTEFQAFLRSLVAG